MDASYAQALKAYEDPGSAAATFDASVQVAGRYAINLGVGTLLHTALGCGVGAIQGDCAAGAIGALTAELASELGIYSPGQPGSPYVDNASTALARLIGASAAAIAGGDAAVGGMAGENAVRNNWLTRPEDVESTSFQNQLDRSRNCLTPTACDSIASALRNQAKELTAERIASICESDAQCIAYRTRERDAYVEVANEAERRAKEPERIALDTLRDISGAERFSEAELAGAIERIRSQSSVETQEVGRFAREGLIAAALPLFGVLIGAGITDTDGGGYGGAGRAAQRTSSAGYSDLAKPNSSTPANTILGALDEFGRPTGVTATINQDSLGAGAPANPSITPPGFGGQGANHSRAHLLANMLGGAGDDARNLVTLFQRNANHPNMSSFERQVQAAVRGGETVTFRAIPIYSGDNQIPIGVTLTARGSAGFRLDVSIQNVSGVP